MSSSINNSVFLETLVSGLMVLAGVSIKNGADQILGEGGAPATVIGIIVFIGGWLAVVKALTYKDGQFNPGPRSTGVIFASIVIVVSLMLMIKGEEMNTIPLFVTIAVILFQLAWLALGYFSSLKADDSMGNGFSRIIGIGGSIFTIVNTLLLMPWQRTVNLVDGPGMVMSALTWVGIALANSMR